MYKCDLCGLELSRKDDLNRHNKTIHGGFSHKCNLCERTFNRKDNLKAHQNRHISHPYKFYGLPTSTNEKSNLQQPTYHHPSTQGSSTENQFSTTSIHPKPLSSTIDHPATTSSDQNLMKKKRKHRKILGDTARTYVLPSSSPPLDVYLESLRTILFEEISGMLKLHQGILFYVTIQILYVRPDNWENNELDLDQTAYHSSNTLKVLPSSDLQELIDETFISILNKTEVFLRNGSGWVIDDILPGELFIGAYQPLHQEDESN